MSLVHFLKKVIKLFHKIKISNYFEEFSFCEMGTRCPENTQNIMEMIVGTKGVLYLCT